MAIQSNVSNYLERNIDMLLGVLGEVKIIQQKIDIK